MKVKMPMLSAEARGAISGVEFRQGIYGPMVGLKSLATPQNTPMGLLRRSQMSRAHRAYEALSEQDKAAWELYAQPPANGRNTFIAAYLRFKMLYTTPILSPLPSVPNNPLAHLRVTPIVEETGSVNVTWNNWSGAQGWLLMFLLPTFSHRQSPTLSKMKFIGAGFDSDNDTYVDVTYGYPIYHLRIDQVNKQNGALIGRHLFRFPDPGWPPPEED